MTNLNSFYEAWIFENMITTDIVKVNGATKAFKKGKQLERLQVQIPVTMNLSRILYVLAAIILNN